MVKSVSGAGLVEGGGLSQTRGSLSDKLLLANIVPPGISVPDDKAPAPVWLENILDEIKTSPVVSPLRFDSAEPRRTLN